MPGGTHRALEFVIRHSSLNIGRSYRRCVCTDLKLSIDTVPPRLKTGGDNTGPSLRLWEIEDRIVNFGKCQVKPTALWNSSFVIRNSSFLIDYPICGSVLPCLPVSTRPAMC